MCFRGHVVLMPDFSLPLEYYLIPFLIIAGICLILIVVFMVGTANSLRSTNIFTPELHILWVYSTCEPYAKNSLEIVFI